MIDRYTRKEMAALWSEDSRLRSWLDVELAVCEVLTLEGIVPEEDMAVIREKADFDIDRIAEIEATVGHDVIAFCTSVAEKVGPASRHIHYGLTSSDVVDTAQALRIVRATDRLLAGIEAMLTVLRKQALAHRQTVMVGRTHGIHAEPYTLGLKFASWYAEAQRNRQRLTAVREEIAVGKISGSVGTYAHLGPQVEAAVMERLGLKAETVSTQVVARDRLANYMGVLGVLASSLDRIATEIRHLQRSDVREVEEPFRAGQKGSSSMPHKRNPIRCENVSGLARVVRSNVQAALENVALWHERDISHSSVERVIVPDSTTLCDFMLSRMTSVLDGLHVYPERMQQNMQITRGLVFSQAVLLALTESGMARDDAFAIVQRNAMRTWAGEGSFRELLAADDAVLQALPDGRFEACFEPEKFLQHVDTIYERTFGGKQ
ncbi:MAG: adenylosuccinate lyase [Acidobacteriota bacterium]|nr:adenylosuccinate lyase [Acidobacteriota bacterium]MDH3786702.1 adenylosuccinate lyase [Acidobacteriota bacterium]